MLQINGTIVSLDVLEKYFVCDLPKCKGLCCIEGDSGAPLEKHETEKLERLLPKIKPYMNHTGLKAVETQGSFIIDHDGDYVTPLVNDKECAYVYFEDDIAKCAIEKAYIEGKITFRKPISCHLYPIMINKYPTFDGVNYHTQTICDSARINGKKLNVPVYVFLEAPLIRKYGTNWYNELTNVAQTLNTPPTK